ncbi:MAG: methyltransferase, partial [Xenococcus sp. (in: cyanobacteria)]
MPKKYVASTFLKLQDSHVYTIFAWSQKSAEIVPTKSWLTVLEIFVHEHSIPEAYAIFETIRLAPIPEQVTVEVEKYQNLLQDAIVLLSDGNLTIFGKGFRSFIEKDMQFELGTLSKDTYQVLAQLFSSAKLEDDLETIDSREKFSDLVVKLANLGLLSPAPGSVDWGDLKKTVPICQAFGLTRGTPVDRYYLSKFITEIRPQIVGKVLEIGGTPKDKDFYELNSGTSYQVLNLEAGPGIDIVGDVHDSSIIN